LASVEFQLGFAVFMRQDMLFARFRVALAEVLLNGLVVALAKPWKTLVMASRRKCGNSARLSSGDAKALR
jgi:hypothetical protein